MARDADGNERCVKRSNLPDGTEYEAGTGYAILKQETITGVGGSTFEGDPPPKGIKPPPTLHEGLAGVLAGAISAYFNTLAGGGTGSDAGLAAKQQLAGGLATVAKTFGAQAFGGGIGGALAGALLGGVVGWGLSAVLGLNKPRAIEHDKPGRMPIMNALDMIKLFTLPGSGYFQPTGRNTGPVQFYQNNTIQVQGGAKQATRLQSALTDPLLLRQLDRGLT